MLHLKVLRGTELKNREELRAEDATVSVGRDAGCAFSFTSQSVSRNHGEFTRRGRRLVYKDHNSRNGSRIIQRSGRVIELGTLLVEHEMEVGDILELGEVQVEVTRFEAESQLDDSGADYTMVGNLSPIPVVHGADDPDGAILNFLELPHFHPTDVGEAVESLAEKIAHTLPYASCTAVALIRESAIAKERLTGADLEYVGVHRSGPSDDSGVSVSILNGALRQKAAVCFSQASTNLPPSESVALADMRSCLCAPLLDERGVFGFLQVYSAGERGRSFGQRDLHVVSVIAGIISMLLRQIRAAQNEAQLRTFASVGQVVAGMSHDAKNILVSLGASAASLQREFGELAESNKWRNIQEDMDFLRFLVQDTWSRIGTHVRKSVVEEVSLAALVDDMTSRCMRYFVQESECKRYSVLNHIPPDLTIRLDADLLSVALFNSLKNAIDAFRFAPQSSRLECAKIQIFARRWAGDGSPRVELSMVDDAGGMPESVRSRIGRELISTKGELGAGLGSRILLEAVARLGGAVQLATATQSDAFPPGTCLTFQLPEHPPEEQPGEAPGERAEVQKYSFQFVDDYDAHRRCVTGAEA